MPEKSSTSGLYIHLKTASFILLLGLVSLFPQRGISQLSTETRHIAIFLPLYLDSAFDAAGNYKFDKAFPKFLNPGLEFLEGAQLALDSLKQEGAHLDVHIYDTRSARKPITTILQEPDFAQMGLIIGHVNAADLRMLANAARQKNIPFINVNFPNDGGISNNPDLVLLNSTLKTHCEGIYKFLQKNNPTSQITIFRKKGATDDRLNGYFTDIDKNTASVPLHPKYVTLAEPINTKLLASYLDSTAHNTVVVASFDDNFSRAVTMHLAEFSKSYPLTVIGMPTWDNIPEFLEQEYAGIDIIYTTPFYVNPAENLTKSLQQSFRTTYLSRPSDLVFRGYETTWHFAKLLQEFGSNLSGSIGEKKYRALTEFDIEPVFLNRQNMTLDYFENKKLYFIKKRDGTTSLAN